MAEKGFGVKEINLIGASGTPTIESPNNLNLNAVNVAISTNVSIGGTLTVSGNISVGGTLTYEDVTNIDSVGIITARAGVNLTGGNITLGDSGGSSDDRISIGAGGDINIYHDGTDSYVSNATGDLRLFSVGGSADDVLIRAQDDIELQPNNGQSGVKVIGTGAVELYHNNSKKFETQTNGVTVQGSVFALGTTPQLRLNSDTSDGSTTRAMFGMATANNNFVNGSTANDVVLNCPKDFIISHGTTELMAIFKDDSSVQLYCDNTLRLQTTNSGVTITGTLAATAVTGDGSALTGIAVTEAPVADYTITANGSSAYRFHGGGVDETADNPDLYLERGKKYRFNNTTGSSHPFRFRVSSGGSTYSTGVTGSENGIQFFTVPYDAPPSIVYQCTIHGGMVGTIYIGGGQYQTRSNNLCLQYTRNSSNYTSGTIIYDTEVFDVGDSNAYNTSNGEFTAPVTGVYRIQYEYFAAGAGRATAGIEKYNGSSWSTVKNGMRIYSQSSGSNWASVPTIFYLQLNATEKFRIIWQEGTVHLNNPWNHLTVQLVQ